MATHTVVEYFCLRAVLVILSGAVRSGEGAVAVAVASPRPPPAMYVFGDSLADVGNNNHLETLLRADFPHNGVDYPGRKATGRFSNGKNAADFLAEKLGLPSYPPPYLAISNIPNNTDIFLTGVNFASGGSGILDNTNTDQCIAFAKQIDYYSAVYGSIVSKLGVAAAQAHFSKSLFGFVIGSNDVFDYVKSDPAKKANTSPQQFVDTMISSMQTYLTRVYNLGARKFVFVGTGPVGCCPSQRIRNRTDECNAEANYISVQYNKGAASLLAQMKAHHPDMNYSFFDTYSALLQYIQKPASYGFTEAKAACCGLGDLNAKVACLPIVTFCSNRKDHIFWDFYHPTETTAGMLSNIVFDGSPPFVFPINVRQLAAL